MQTPELSNAPLKPYGTLQDAFNVAYRGLKAQGWKKSIMTDLVNPTGPSCVYRSKIDGQTFKCAVGHLIPDNFVHDNNNAVNLITIMDRSSVHYDPRWKPLFENIDPNELFNLQLCHDQSQWHIKEAGGAVSDMPERLEKFAQFYNLTIPE